MAKTHELKSKIEDIQDAFESELLKAGIINKGKEILDKKAFIKFIDTKKREIEPQMDAATKDGVVIDQYSYNILGTAMEYLDKMAEQMSTRPSLGTSHPIKDDLEDRIEQKEKARSEKRNQREERRKADRELEDPKHPQYYNALLNNGIINEQMEILDKKAFVAFIDTLLEEYNQELDSLNPEGVIWANDRYRANILDKEINHLEGMKSSMSLTPDKQEITDDLEEQYEQMMQRKEARRNKRQANKKKFETGVKKVAKRLNIFSRLSNKFSRDK